MNGKFLVRKGFFTKLLSNRLGALGAIFQDPMYTWGTLGPVAFVSGRPRRGAC